MPIVSNEGLDDPLLFEQTNSFVGGVNNLSAAKLLEPSQSVELVNVDIDRVGNAVTRRGTASLASSAVPEGTSNIQGMAYFDTGTINQLVICKNRKIFYYDGVAGSGSWVQEGSSYLTNAADDSVYFAQLSNKLYFCDGTSDLKSFDGTNVNSIPAAANAPTGIKLLASHTQRLFAVRTAEPDAIYVSDLLSVEGTSAWSSVDSFRVGGDGEPIIALQPWTGFRLVVFKLNSTYVIETDPTASISGWIVETISKEVGCIAPRSVVQVMANIYWLANDGVRTLARTLQGNENEISDPLSKIIDSTIQEINPAQIQKAAGAYYSNRYILSLPISSSSTNNATIVYNTIHRSWSGKWTGDFKASAFARYTNDPNNLLAIATPDGRVLRWLAYIRDEAEVAADYQDSGSPIITSITTREFAFGEPMSYKSLYNVEVQFYSSTAFVSVYVLDDLGNTITAFSNIDSSAASGGLGILVLPFILDANAILRNQKARRRAKSLLGNTPKRGVQVIIESSSGKLSLQNATVSAFVDSFQPEEL